MKKSDLKQLIREEMHHLLNETKVGDINQAVANQIKNAISVEIMDLTTSDEVVDAMTDRIYGEIMAILTKRYVLKYVQPLN